MKNLISIIIVLALIFLLYFFGMRFTPVSIFEKDGYVISSNQITANLLNNKLDRKNATIRPVKVYAYDYLYTQQGRLFVGEVNKEMINAVYPIFTNDNLAIVNLSSDSILVDENFRKYEGYKNFTLTSGALYNKDDLTRADINNYIFLQLPNLMMLNSKPITVKTTLSETKIVMNSIISFNEKYIRYYSPNGDKFNYYEIQDVDMSSVVEINGRSHSYKELLTKLGIIEFSSGNDQGNNEKPGQSGGDNNPSGPNNPGEPVHVPYAKPIVKCGDFVANVYSADSTLDIYDPSGTINNPVTFQVRTKGKLYLRKSYTDSGNIQMIGLSPDTQFEITGSFTYINEDKKEISETCLTQTINTKGVEELTPITFEFSNGPIYSNKIELDNFKVTDGLGTETAKGIKKADIIINNNTYRMAGSDLNTLLNGKSITYNSPETLKSNSEIDYKIVLFDNYNNELKVINNSGRTLTAKAYPKATVRVEKNDISDVQLRVELENLDNIPLANYKYVVNTNNSKTIQNGTVPQDGLIILNDLDADEVFNITIYADFDIDNGEGTLKDRIIGTTKFASVPITTLGYIKIKLQTSDILQSTGTIKMSIDVMKTDSRLLNLLKSLDFNLVKVVNQHKESVYSKQISNDDIQSLKWGGIIDVNVDNLTSSTEYYIEIESVVGQATKDYSLPTSINLKSFKTLKKNAEVLVRNMFSNESLIDFDVKIIDEDQAILNNKVTLEVRDNVGRIVKVENIKINDDYVRLTYDKLNSKTGYTFTYIAGEYNIGHDNSTYYSNYTIKKHTVYTEMGISGKLDLQSLLGKPLGKNLFNINNTSGWEGGSTNKGTQTINPSDNTITITTQANTGTGGIVTNYFYPLLDYIGKNITVSFNYKCTQQTGVNYDYQNEMKNGGSSGYRISCSTNGDWLKYTGTYTLMNSGYIKFSVTNNANSPTGMIVIKDLQVELGNKATSYEAFVPNPNYEAELLVNLNDTKDEITTDDYYIKIYKNDVLDSTHTYSIGSTNNVNQIFKFVVDKNAKYKFELSVKIRDRFYVLHSTSFTTETEIRSIKTPVDLIIAYHKGKYIVLNDLDFTTYAGGSYTYYIDRYFDGEIDFQGHTVKMDIKTRSNSSLIYQLNSTGTIKNINIEVAFNATASSGGWQGLMSANYGIIENIMVTITDSIASANTYFCSVARNNYNIIKNFVVNSAVPLHVRSDSSLLVIYNSGIIKNGYVYGEAIDGTYSNDTSYTKNVGSIVASTDSKSRIENVFSLVPVNTLSTGANNKQVGAIIGNGTGIIKNAYSVGDGLNANLSGDPNVGTITTPIPLSSNLFYASPSIYNAKYSQKVSSLAINDTEFQNRVLNNDNHFIVDELVSKKFYPQIIMPDCMPLQEWIPLIEVDDKDLIDVMSSEVLENNTTSAKVLLHVNNPAAERITKIDIKDVTTNIVSQTNVNGKSEVIVTITNPVQCVSKYYIKAVTSVGPFDITYTRTYLDNERALYVDLYRGVSNINDWKVMKTNPNENYKLLTDLDFKYAADFLISILNGKLNGDGYTISNIQIDSGACLFNSLYGQISNLYIKNYKKTVSSTYGGLIGYAYSGSVIDNVHMSDVTISASSFIGGLVGYGAGVTIKNSSVSNFKNADTTGFSGIRIGGLVGSVSRYYIENSFAGNVNIDATAALSTSGIGGLAGELYEGITENVYATGYIKTGLDSVGGIAGVSQALINNAFTYVNIESASDYIGGIVGKSTFNGISNTLVLGEIYSSYPTVNTHRTIGNLVPAKNNYAYDKQLIDGYVSDVVNGETLLSYSSLSSEQTYRNIIKFDNNFDYSKVSSGVLPKLKNIDTGALLPNQSDVNIDSEQFAIISVDIVKRVTDATILVSFRNPDNLEIKDIGFDYFDIAKVSKKATINGVTSIEVIVNPSRYLDSYKFNKINYIQDGKLQSYSKLVKIPLQFYKNLEKFEDWQQIKGDVPENYHLVGDIDFAGKVNIKTNIPILRLESLGGNYSFKNLTMQSTKDNQSLIKEIILSFKNVTFDNITINDDRTSGSADSIIGQNYGSMEGVTFKNITINAPNIYYLAPIYKNSGILMNNITIDNINITGRSYLGGLVYLVDSTKPISNVQASNVTINGQDNVGGIIATSDGTYSAYPLFDNLNATNMTITGRSYVGGIWGNYALGSGATIKDSTIIGNNYVGGIVGNTSSGVKNQEVRNCYIKGSSFNVGGAIGSSSGGLDKIFVYDSTIEGLTTSSTEVGGIVGNMSTTNFQRSGVLNSIITSGGDNVGGIAGAMWGATSCYVYNADVTGKNNVGGITGKLSTSTINDVYSNAYVTATGMNAGGLYGYINGTGTGTYRGIVAGGSVTAPTNVGGIIGSTSTTLGTGHQSIIVDTNIYKTNDLGLASPTVGSNSSYASSIANLTVYDQTKINSVAVKDMTNTGLTAANLVTAADLALQTTYTNKGFITSRWDFSSLSDGYFPYVYDAYGTSTRVPNQVPIPLPTDLQPMMMRLIRFGKPHILPTFDAYAVGVDKLNLEFSKIDEATSFTLTVNGKDMEPHIINERVYTFSYDYKTPFDITLSDGINRITKTINPSTVKREASVYDNNYYYIRKDHIISNSGITAGSFVNLYNNQALKENGNIYDLKTKTEIESEVKGLSLLNDVLSLFDFTYGDLKIKTYNKFSITEKDGISTIEESQLLVKNGMLEIIDSSLPSIKDSVIIDQYGGNAYETVLGTDGILYNLKTSLNVPNDFVGSNIKYMTNNILDNTGFVVIVYNDGSFYGFDYRTGKRLFYDKIQKVQRNISLVDYLKEKLSAPNYIIDGTPYKSYQETKLLKEKLTSNPIEKVLNKDTSKDGNNTGTNNQLNNKIPKYVMKYDYTKKEFTLYDEKALLPTNKDKLPETAKISANINLIEFYFDGGKDKKGMGSVNGLITFTLIIGAIFISLLGYFKNIKFFKRLANKA